MRSLKCILGLHNFENVEDHRMSGEDYTGEMYAVFDLHLSKCSRCNKTKTDIELVKAEKIKKSA